MALTSKLDIATAIRERLWNTLFLAFWAAAVSVRVQTSETMIEVAATRLMRNRLATGQFPNAL